MNLNIELDDSLYRSRAIHNGQKAKKFFCALSNNLFRHSYKYWRYSQNIIEEPELPVLHRERNIYSSFASAINSLTPIHLSEWSFNRSDEEGIKKSSRVDFWCLYKEKEKSESINYYIEVKKGWYNLNKRSKEEFHVQVRKDIEDLVEQTSYMKEISPNWDDYDDVYLGIAIISGFYNDNPYYSEKNIRDNVIKKLDGRSGAQVLISTWQLPENMNIVLWENQKTGSRRKVKFISIVGIILSKRRNK